MAVQLPQVKRFEPVAPDSAGRIETSVPDASRALAGNANAIVDTAQTMIGLYEKAEDDAADTYAHDKANQYERWYNSQLYGDSASNTVGLVNQEGDPTEAYTNFDKMAEEKFNEISGGEDSSMSDKTKRRVKSALADRYNSLYNKRLSHYGSQYDNYQQRVTDDSVSLEKSNATDALANLDPKRPETFVTYDKSLERIKNFRLKQGLKLGSVQLDPNGKAKYVDDDGNIQNISASPTVVNEIKKDLSETIYDSVDNLIKSDHLPQAEATMKRYAGYLDPVRQGKLNESFTNARIEADAYAALDKAEDRTYKGQKAVIDAIKDPKVKHKALELLDAHERYMTNNQARDSKEAYNELAISIQKIQRSDNPYDNIFQMEADKRTGFKMKIDRVTDAAQRKALYALVEKPNESNQSVKAELMQQLADGKFFGMKYEDLALQKVGLSKRDSDWFDTQWTKENTDTDSMQRGRIAFVASEAKRIAETLKVTTEDGEQTKTMIRGPRNKPSKESLRQFNDFYTDLITESDAWPKNMPPDQMTKKIRDRVAERIIENKRNESSWFGRLVDKVNPFSSNKDVTAKSWSETRTSPVPKAKAKSGFASLSNVEQDAAWKEFEKSQGRAPKDMKELEDWLANKGTK